MPIRYRRRMTITQQYRSELAQQLSTVNQYCTGNEHVDEAWQNVKGAKLTAFSAVCPTSPNRPQDHWMSASPAAVGVQCCLSDFSKSTTRPLDVGEVVIHDSCQESNTAGNEHDGARKFFKRQIVKSLRKDREIWWKSKAREMEKAFATGRAL
ncbi:hypothetical protein CLF_108555 [Clonorchis sinensis]|uniref:ATP-binding cassette transporter n=1 Tax=Clonorchis sinensis TaxID=79923 RepID=G7YRQ6_CLOSI|nr:hypothetical protein CLF_108555 [Clonorchis sinensis]